MLMGLGQNCPSVEQAQGIVDCNDPCQIGGPACPVASSPAGTSASGTVIAGNFCLTPSFPWVGTGSTTGACQSLSGAGLGFVALSSVFLMAFFIGGRK
jgi:hypothetical protein